MSPSKEQSYNDVNSTVIKMAYTQSKDIPAVRIQKTFYEENVFQITAII